MFVVMATFLFQVRMYTGPGELVGTVRGEFTVANNTIQLARKSRTSTPPVTFARQKKGGFPSALAGSITGHPRALPGNC